MCPTQELRCEIETSLERLVPGAELVHEFRMRARSEWQVLRTVGAWVGDRAVRLRRIKLSRQENGFTCVTFQCAGLSISDAEALLDAIRQERAIAGAKVEHIMMRPPERPQA